jgi:hypothetical protein
LGADGFSEFEFMLNLFRDAVLPKTDDQK